MPTFKQRQQFVGILDRAELADREYWAPGRIDILFGIGFWNEVFSNGILRERVNSVSALAQQTVFGWVATTHHYARPITNGRTLNVVVSDDPAHRLLAELNDSIKRFW